MSYDTYTTIPALTQPKVGGKHADASGGSKLVKAISRAYGKKRKRRGSA